MPEPLPDAVAEVRALLLDPGLRRAVAAGKRHGAAPPTWRRAELRPVELKDGRRLQQVCYDDRQAHTSNLAYPTEAEAGIDALLAEPYGNWHVETAESTVQLRVTKKGQAQVHRETHQGMTCPGGSPAAAHDRAKPRLIDPGDPLFDVLGADAAKRRQVDAFLRLLAPTLEAVADREPLHVVDLGCGNAYLSFAAHRYLAAQRGGARLTGVDLRDKARARNTAIATKLGAVGVEFVAGTITDAELPAGDVVLALHACDTATDDALARAVRWEAPVVIAAPCCHHETAAAIKAAGPPEPYGLIGRARDPARADGRRAHRLPARHPVAPARVPRRRRRVRQQRAHRPQRRDPRGAHRRRRRPRPDRPVPRTDQDLEPAPEAGGAVVG